MLGAGNVVVTLNGTAITAYCNKGDLETTIAELDKTNFASTGTESDPGVPTHKITLGGLWVKALNNVLSPLANSPSKVTCVLTIGSGAEAVTYTWTSNALVTNYKRTLGAVDQSTWSATLNLSGAPSMS